MPDEKTEPTASVEPAITTPSPLKRAVVNRELPEHNPELDRDDKDVASDTWAAAGGAPRGFDRWWEAITTTTNFDSLKALVSVTWHAAGGTDDGFETWWNQLSGGARK